MAQADRLGDPQVLGAQAARLAADPKANLETAFVGQWLDVAKLGTVQKDPMLYPAFTDAQLRADLGTETQLFVRGLMDQNAPVAALLTADSSFLNERLAGFYGVTGVSGASFRKTPLPGQRSGILTQGSVLAVNSGPLNTSPVKRGKMVLERILCAPPAPPPAGVPPLPPLDAGTLTKRELFAQHSQNPVCASCHKAMEPLGFAFERFDVTGRSRTLDEHGDPVDTSGQLTDGTTFGDAVELDQVLAVRPQVTSCLVKNLAVYGLDRALDATDRARVAAIAQDVEDRQLGLKDLLVRVASDPLFTR
jgi:hypothetical protein